jgi:hypothetical protein
MAKTQDRKPGVMALFVLAALVGLFGGVRSATALTKRPTAAWRWTLSLGALGHHHPGDGSPKRRMMEPKRAKAVLARVFVSNEIVEPLGLQQVIPQPNATEAIGGGAVYYFAIPPGQDSAMVRFVLKPSAVGLVSAEVRQGAPGGESLTWIQLVLPRTSFCGLPPVISSCCSRCA